jgi:hypothetical protein
MDDPYESRPVDGTALQASDFSSPPTTTSPCRTVPANVPTLLTAVDQPSFRVGDAPRIISIK